MKMEEVYLLHLIDNRNGSGNGNGNGSGNGNGNGNGSGDGYGNGNGSGNGNGNGNGSGDGYGNGSGNGSGNGYGNGYGNGSGNGNGYGNGSGNGYGNGSGSGNGSGNGNGNGYGYGNGIYLAKIYNEWFQISENLENSLCYNLPEHLFNKIDRDFILRVDNLESLRVIRDKIGIEKYLSLLGAKVINEQIDYQGNKMKLYECSEVGEKSILLEVVCPSTQRVFHLYPPNQKAKTCFEAKHSTFDNKPLAVRHGDVGLFKVDGDKISIPFSET